jgi:hypothetical protein
VVNKYDKPNSKHCWSQAKSGFCTNAETKFEMEEDCAKTCAILLLCSKPKLTTILHTTTIKTIEVENTTEMEDKNENCGTWACEGHCNTKDYKTYMETNCPVACQTDKVDKLDKAEDCLAWGKIGYCTSTQWKEYMNDKCGKTCLDARNGCPKWKVITTPVPCKDVAQKSDCDGWKESKMCTIKQGQYYQYMKDKCAKTCNFCT